MKTTGPREGSLDVSVVLSASYPSRGAAEVLSQRVCHLLSKGGYGQGDRFLTDDELVGVTGLSRSTVRRALIGLTQGGWLDRRAGLGTFVGRVSERGVGQGEMRVEAGARAMRLGVIAFNRKVPAYDWLTPQLMQGISACAGPMGARVELLAGLSESFGESLEQLERSGQDVVLCLSADPSDAMLVRAASERGLRCMVAGTLFPELEVPRVCEDNRSGIDFAVRRLAELGHERIGLVMRRWVGAWLFKRHEQWHDTMRELGLPMDEQLMHWLPQGDEKLSSPEAIAELSDWIRTARPTALICGHYLPALHLGQLRREGRLAIPEDLSVVVVDRHPEVSRMLGMDPTSMELPLHAMGRTLVEHAARWCAGEVPASLTQLPMTWRDGATVRPRVR